MKIGPKPNMRYYRRIGASLVEVRHLRAAFFLLGPAYLLWLRLWKEAFAVTAGVWLVVHGALVLMRSALGSPPKLDFAVALATMQSLRNGEIAGSAADEAVRTLVRTLLPYYAAAAALLCLMSGLTWLLPRYLSARSRRGGPVIAVHDGSASPDTPATGNY